MENSKLLKNKDIRQIIDNYQQSTGIYCQAFRLKNSQIENFLQLNNFMQQASFCKFIHQCDRGLDECRQSYIYGGLQSKKLGDKYIYFCPYGLVNWVVPIFMGEDEKKEGHYFLTGGPVLMHQVDDLLIENISKQNPELKTEKDELIFHLANLDVVSTRRVKHLAELLMHLAKSLLVENIVELKQKRKTNVMNARVAEVIHDLKEKNREQNKKLYPLEKEDELINQVKLGDKKRAQEILNELLGFVYFQHSSNFTMVKARVIQLTDALARAAIKVGADLEIIFGLEYIFLDDINKAEKLTELSQLLTQILDRFIECAFLVKDVKNKNIIYKAMNFIRDNYNQDISLQKVASEVGLSSSYFSKMFKEEMNISYSDYLNKVRVAKGKELLKRGLSLAEIAQKIGFNDQSYFSRVFKRFVGVSPGRWKKQEEIESG
ncbi:MAG: PocR ligand-binding domain-containing protein [Halanaerobiaceae bacterium]